MNRLRQTLGLIRTSLGQLTVSQRLLIAALMVVGLMSLMLVALTTSRSVMVELLPGMAGADQGRAKEYLASIDVPYEMKSGKVMVAADKRTQVLAMMGQAGQLPENTGLLFANLANHQNWMNSKSMNDQWANIALQNELARVIANFKGVERAVVMIDAPEPIGMGMAYRRPTAMATVFTRAGHQVDRDTVDAIAAMVAGAKAGMRVTDVKVIDGTTQRQYTARSPEDFRAGDYMEHVAKIEERFQEKILSALRYIPGVVVAVSAQVDVRRTETTTAAYLPVGEGSVSVVTKENTTTKSETSSAAGVEPGVRINTGDDINRSAAGGPKRNDETSDTTFSVGLGRKNQTVVDPRGMPTKVNVMINLSREYVAALARQAKASGAPAGGAAADAEPTEAELKAQFDAEKKRIEEGVRPLVETTSGEGQAQAGSVVVSMIPVALRAAGTGVGSIGLPGGEGTGAAAAGPVGELLSGGMLKTALLGVLAVVALGMMMLMVRKASRPAELPDPKELVGVPPALQTQSDLVGEADETQTAMMGIELGEDQLKTKKMLEQVAELVKKNPQDAASILNRWIAVEA
ncbi:MAG: hypothetical protein KIT68_07595 [Phycisphaeraceae bacterium]|nr:hypothetical protein [Phycisphaeraceae bacterium]